MLEVRLLGQFETCLNGAKVKILSRAEQSLLAYLILNAGTPFRREYLAGLIWPDSGESDARGYLRQALWRLRKALAAGQSEVYDYFLGDKISLEFNTRLPYWVDAAVFEEGNRDELEDLLAAAQVYHGELLPGFYEDWVVLERERLRGKFERVMQGLLERLQSESRWEELQQQAERWIALGDTPEPAYRALILAHTARGDISSAMTAYRRCQQALERELGVSPSLETTRLVEQIRAGRHLQGLDTVKLAHRQELLEPEIQDVWQPGVPRLETFDVIIHQGNAPPEFTHNLPAQSTPFVGRETELDEIAALLANPDCRLLTLAGPGGIGKSRLALKAAEEQIGSYQHGVCFVSLAGIASVEFIPYTILIALAHDLLSKSDPKQVLLSYLREREMLLVLDNFEHLLGGTGLLVDLLRHAPGVKLIVTSRERLNLQSEWILPLDGLSYPPLDHISQARDYASVALFTQTAQRVQANFDLNESNEEAVARICRFVEGMPLAIELAATWIQVLDPQSIAKELEQSLDILEMDIQDLPERQRSMRAVFNASWEMLNQEERVSVQELSIFRGGFDLAVAEKAFGIPRKMILALVHKCWVQPEIGGRFHMHELLRQYAGERLMQGRDAWEHACETHSVYFCRYLKERDKKWSGSGIIEIFPQIKDEIHNIEAAWKWALLQSRLDLIGQASHGLFSLYFTLGRIEDGAATCRKVVERLSEVPFTDEETEAHAYILRAYALAWQGLFCEDLQLAVHLFEQATQILDRLEDRGHRIEFEKARILMMKGNFYFSWDHQRGLEYGRQSAALFDMLGEKYWQKEALMAVGGNAYGLGDLDQALSIARQCQSLKMEIVEQEPETFTQIPGGEGYEELLGKILREKGQFEEAERYQREILSFNKRLGVLFFVPWDLSKLAHTHLCAGKYPEALAGAQESVGLKKSFSDPLISYDAHIVVSALLHLGEYAQARRLSEITLEDAFKYNDPFIGFAYYCLGQVELVEYNFIKAFNRFQEALSTFQERNSVLNTGLPMGNLVYTARALKRPNQADHYTRECLKLACKIGFFRSAIHALPALALLEADQGRVERGVELYALACNYPYIANSKWFEDIAGKHIKSASASLPAETFTAAQARGRSLDFWETIKRWLAG